MASSQHSLLCREAFDHAVQSIFTLATDKDLSDLEISEVLRDTLRVTHAEARKIMSGWSAGKYKR